MVRFQGAWGASTIACLRIPCDCAGVQPGSGARVHLEKGKGPPAFDMGVHLGRVHKDSTTHGNTQEQLKDRRRMPWPGMLPGADLPCSLWCCVEGAWQCHCERKRIFNASCYRCYNAFILDYSVGIGERLSSTLNTPRTGGNTQAYLVLLHLCFISFNRGCGVFKFIF